MISFIRENSIKWINYLFILFAFLLPLHKGIENIIIKITFILFLFIPNLKEKLKYLWKNSFFKAYLAFLVYNLLVILWTPDKIYGIHYVQKYFKYLVIFPFFLTLNKKTIKYSISAFLGGLFVSEIISYGIFFHLWQTVYNKAYFGYYDPTPFMHHSLYSLFLGLGIIILVLKFIYDSTKLEKVILSFFMITMTINIFITGGRAGQLAFFITSFILIFYSLIEQKKVKVLIIVLLPLIIFILAYKFSPIFHDRINFIFGDLKQIKNLNFCGSWGQRVGAWIVSFEIFRTAPLFGLGFKEPLNFLHYLVHTKEFSYLKCIDNIYSHTHLHNEYLMQLTQIGLIGIIFYLNLWYQLIKLKIKEKFFRYIKISFISMFLLTSFAEPIFTTSWTINLFIFFTTLILTASTYYETNNIHQDSV